MTNAVPFVRSHYETGRSIPIEPTPTFDFCDHSSGIPPWPVEAMLAGVAGADPAQGQYETAGDPRRDRTAGWNVFAPENAGFYPIEISRETKFRWSETAAIMPGWTPAGQHRICIECLPVRSLMHAMDLRFYFNERPLSVQDVSIGPETIEIKLDVTQSGHSTLAWTCPLPGYGRPTMAGSADQTHRVDPRPARFNFEESVDRT